MDLNTEDGVFKVSLGAEVPTAEAATVAAGGGESDPRNGDRRSRRDGSRTPRFDWENGRNLGPLILHTYRNEEEASTNGSREWFLLVVSCRLLALGISWVKLTYGRDLEIEPGVYS